MVGGLIDEEKEKEEKEKGKENEEGNKAGYAAIQSRTVRQEQ